MSQTTLAKPPEIVFDVDIAKHNADLARRQAERDARREEQIKCLDPNYARQKEMEKPRYQWTVKAEWLAKGNNDVITQFDAEQTVVAQDEKEAWAKFCDNLQTWPNYRDAKPTFKRGKQMSATEVAAEVEPHKVFPRETLGKKPVRLKLS